MAGYPVQRRRPPVTTRAAARRRARDSGTLSGTSAEEEQMTGKSCPARTGHLRRRSLLSRHQPQVGPTGGHRLKSPPRRPACTWRGGKDSPSGGHLVDPVRRGTTDWPGAGCGVSREAGACCCAAWATERSVRFRSRWVRMGSDHWTLAVRARSLLRRNSSPCLAGARATT
jgi:hypothetical protein